MDGLLREGRLVPLLTDYRPPQLGIHALYGTRTAMRLLLDFIAERLACDAHWPH